MRKARAPSKRRIPPLAMAAAAADPISVKEFVEGCVRYRGPAKAIDVASVHYDTSQIMAKFRCLMHKLDEKLQIADDECIMEPSSPLSTLAL